MKALECTPWGSLRVQHGDDWIAAKATNRAIAGLSMGGGQALDIGLHHPEIFHYILGFSAAVGEPFLAPSEVLNGSQNSTTLNNQIRLLWFLVGIRILFSRAIETSRNYSMTRE